MKKRTLANVVCSLFFSIVLIINCVIAYQAAGINSELIVISFFAACMATYSNILLSRKKIIYHLSSLIGSLLLLIALIIITVNQMPRYTYNEATTMILHNLPENANVEAIHTKTKTMKSTKKLNYFLKRGYVINMQINNQKVSFFFNPINGTYMEINEQ
ncbi:hypothetical protein A7K91_22380 [Paenibacillus oryzae]|uniref:Uncharacterized protein n=1 Tax=Paenibacillus oryzae TaxID=1844972 RepID=A0A1A5YPY7_9BACL|nr:hypothetical protein [Paenibacillus oryzae]OBR67628.1 hypothetical protein A7K91_22380 [Paenibacillus oryzae]